MPTYEYECARCGRRFEIRQRISEPPLERCLHCRGSVRRVLAPTAFILKGAGFYVNDYPSESRKKGLSEEKQAAPPSTPSTPSKSESSPSKA